MAIPGTVSGTSSSEPWGAASVKFPGGVTGVASNELKGVVASELRGPCCFAAGTMVATPSGDRAIDTLKVGEIVWSKPEHGGEPFAAAIHGNPCAHGSTDLSPEAG